MLLQPSIGPPAFGVSSGRCQHFTSHFKHCHAHRHDEVSQRCLRQQAFPTDYADAISQAQAATKAALADGHELIEIEFPAAGLSSVSGDGEGGNEMTYSLGYLRSFCRIFQDQAATTRIYFPDQKEMWMAAGTSGQDGKDADAVFGTTAFQLDYLTRPSFLHDIGLGAFDKVDVSKGVQDSDIRFVVAYPHFNIGEMVAVEEVYNERIKGTSRPLIIFNGELDRIRSGYYPPFFYPGLARMAKDWLTQFCTAFYIHNFKGKQPGVLYRQYPGSWQVFRREGPQLSELRLIHEQNDMPTLKSVSLDILSAKT